MGIYDREYYRDDEPRAWGSHSMVVTLIFINVVVYLIDAFVMNGKWAGSDSLVNLPQDYFRRPWEVWRLVTYGFLHDPSHIAHIVFNMFALWMFGTEVEGVYGRKSFLRTYLSLLITSALVWMLVENIMHKPDYAMPWTIHRAIGASGAISGVIILFVMHFPHRTILLFGVLPTPAWVMGILYIIIDIGQLTYKVGGGVTENVAFAAHLGGALFGYIYYRTHWSLFSWLPDRWNWASVKRKFRSKPKLRVHQEEPPADDLQEEVDRILEKISLTGESSLTPAERRKLEEASERYKKRRS